MCQTPSSWSRAPWSKVNTIQYIWEEMSLTKRISRPVSAPDWLVCILDFLCPKFYIEAEYTWTLSSMSPFTSHQVQAPAPAISGQGSPRNKADKAREKSLNLNRTWCAVCFKWSSNLLNVSRHILKSSSIRGTCFISTDIPSGRVEKNLNITRTRTFGNYDPPPF